MNTAQSGFEDRAYWVATAERIARPVLEALAEGRLKASMPVEAAAGHETRAQATHLEAWCRVLTGLAPWLEAAGLEANEAALVTAVRELNYPFQIIGDNNKPGITSPFSGHLLRLQNKIP